MYYSSQMLNSSQILISVEYPNLILGIETSLFELLGHSPKALYRQSIEIFRGPETDHVQLMTALQAAGLKQALTEFEVILYERSGQPRVVTASFSPCTRTLGHPICSILTLNFTPNFVETTTMPNAYSNISSTHSSFESCSSELSVEPSISQHLLPSTACCGSHHPPSVDDADRCLASYPTTLNFDFADGAEGGAADGWGGHGGGGSWSGFEDRGGWPDWANTAAPPAYPAAGPLAL